MLMVLGYFSVFHGYRRMDPARALCLDCRMETTLVVPAGTKGADTGFSFPFVADSAWTFNQFRSAICDKYP